MKRKLFVTGILFLLFFLIRFPQEALTASREGMKLWLNTLLPTLLPFIILTSFLIHTDGIEKIFAPMKRFWAFFFGLSSSGAYALILGLLCGYPMGAKIASDLYGHGKISRSEAEYLLTFSNNASPAFLTTYLAQICLNGQIPLKQIIGILLLSDLLSMVFFRFFVFHNKTVTASPEQSTTSKKETSAVSSFGTLLDVSIMNGFETITRLGGYILLFSIISAVISHYWKFSLLSRLLILGTLELTTGLHQLAESVLVLPIRYLCSMCMTSFGGICIMAQTKSILHKNLSLAPYMVSKILNAVFTGIIILVFAQIV